jgi:hypothetical protein
MKRKVMGILFSGIMVVSCNNSQQNAQNTVLKSTNQSLKTDTPEVLSQKQKSRQIMNDLVKHLNFIPDMETYLNLVNHFKDKHLFVNADKKGYIVIAVSNKGFNKITESERKRLQDIGGSNSGYQMNFLLHHIFSSPSKSIKNVVYNSLAGESVQIEDNRSSINFKGKSYPITSALKASEDLEIISIDSPLFQ